VLRIEVAPEPARPLSSGILWRYAVRFPTLERISPRGRRAFLDSALGLTLRSP